MNPIIKGFGILIMAVLLSGCLHWGKKIIPYHDEVLVYPLSYDLVYLRTVEAVDNVEGWELEDTVKEKGYINIRNVNYGRLDDSDMRLVTLIIKRVDRSMTTVELAPRNRITPGADKLLMRVSEFISREL
ncbi:MAG: hypothetical protein HYZ85_05360 [Candidatus Omnitrophica bacterium]|nr:hypothetical protein [Candidatus Omnitrophota bacterium]